MNNLPDTVSVHIGIRDISSLAHKIFERLQEKTTDTSVIQKKKKRLDKSVRKRPREREEERMSVNIREEPMRPMFQKWGGWVGGVGLGLGDGV
jgi:hypothetical protein